MEKARRDKKIISGAFLLGVSAFVAKLLGAIYRVPLTNLLGGEGLGLYQMVFPVYTVLLDFSGAGVPSALSRLIASTQESFRKERARAYLTASLRLFLWLGLAFTSLLFVFARPIAKLQGNEEASFGYFFLSPAVLLVSLISCFRGYFQGLMNMKPTAISQVIEQSVKLIFGLGLAKLFLPNVSLAVGGATLAITLSELTALIYLYINYRKFTSKNLLLNELDEKSLAGIKGDIIRLTVPISIVGILIPLSQVADSFLVLNVLGRYLTNSTSLYGILSGVVATVIGLPVAVCYGVATVAIPAVSKGKNKAEQNKNAIKTMLLTLAVALPATAVCYLFAPFIIELLFGRLSEQEKSVAIGLLRLSSPCVLFLSFLQTTNAVLIGKNKPYLPIISLGIGITIKEILNLELLKIPKLNIYGGAVAIIACYFTVCLINLFMIFSFRVKNASKTTYSRQCAS